MSDANKKVVLAIEEAWNANRLDQLDAYFAPDFVQHSGPPAQLGSGLAAAKVAHQMSLQAFPDRKTSVEDIVAGDDQVAVRVRMTGTNKGGVPWLGVPANDRPVDVQWVSIYKLRDGKVVEHRAVMDVLGMMQQLGAIPAPGAGR
ncbi:MAG TPA: ester cyclase [Dehalococcoidia bacterium]|nr:ester cyclase [Dehalococcoidia bacterium]